MPARLLLTLCCLVALPVTAAPAVADGPFEPNEVATQAAGPLLGATVAAAFETPQDVDWYVIYPKPDRQVGVLATLTGSCRAHSGSIRVAVYDPEGPIGLPVLAFTLGYTGWPDLQTADRGSFTSIAGHRYLIKVTDSLCDGTGYTLDVAPREDLSSVLGSTRDCLQARGTAKAAHVRAARLRSAAKKARGRRRADLRRRLALQGQEVAVADATAKTACTRRPLTGYPYM
jgi:hypothetical protein